MLRMNKLTDYATVLMQFLAKQPGDSLYSASELAEIIGLSTATTSKLLKQLAQNGLVQSQQGSQGGYSLGRAADQISLLDIVSAIEEQPNITECALESGVCNREPICQMKHNWQYVNKAIQSILASITLADCRKSLRNHPALRNHSD